MTDPDTLPYCTMRRKIPAVLRQPSASVVCLSWWCIQESLNSAGLLPSRNKKITMVKRQSAIAGFMFSAQYEWHQEQTSCVCLGVSLCWAATVTAWCIPPYGMVCRLDRGRYASRPHTYTLIHTYTNKSVILNILSVKHTENDRCKTVMVRQSESSKDQRTEVHKPQCSSSSLLPSPSLSKSAYVVTNDTFIFLQRLCICKTAEVHQDVKYFGWPPRLLWKITRWKYNHRSSNVDRVSLSGQYNKTRPYCVDAQTVCGHIVILDICLGKLLTINGPNQNSFFFMYI